MVTRIGNKTERILTILSSAMLKRKKKKIQRLSVDVVLLFPIKIKETDSMNEERQEKRKSGEKKPFVNRRDSIVSICKKVPAGFTNTRN